MRERVIAVCPCGYDFETTQDRIDDGRGRYCSRACMYRYRVRPSGLTYNIKKPNPGWFQKGGERLAGPANPQWKGDDVGYKYLHRWVAKHLGRPTECVRCGRGGRIEWANLSHEYRRDLTDWIALCRWCHRAHDRDHRGAAVRKFDGGLR